MEDQHNALGGVEARAATATTNAAASAEPAETFEVQFRVVQGRRRASSGAASLRGKGRISVEHGQFTFEGHRGPISWLSRKQVMAVPVADVFDVTRAGKVLSFKLRSDKGGIQTIDLGAANLARAMRLQARLPQQMSEAFAVAQAEHADFHARLDELSPHAPVVPVLVAINALVFVAMCVAGVGIFQPDGAAVVPWGSNFGPLTTSGQWWRLLSSTFVHFGLLHIAFNMWALFASGRMVERLFGSARFVLLYLFAGVAASMVSLLWNPGVNSAGASGAIFGVFGGLLAFVMNPRNAVPQSVMVEHRNSTIAFAAYTLFYGAAHSGIDNAAHIGGLLAGLAMGFVLARPLTVEARRRSSANGLILALGSGLIALIALSWPLAHPNAQTLREQKFSVVRGRLGADEEQAIAATQALVQRSKAGQSSELTLAHDLSGEVLPKWNALYDEVASAPLEPGDRDYKLREVMLRYADARRQQFELARQALVSHDKSRLAESDAQSKKAEQAIDELKAMQGKGK